MTAADLPQAPLRLRILLVEDSLVYQKLTRALLEQQGHEVTLAGNGKEALAALESKSFDLVLMDIEMPEMDGLDATRLIRARERQLGGHLPIIALTTVADPQRCLAAGMDQYVEKPVQPTALRQTIDHAVQHGRGRAAAAAGKRILLADDDPQIVAPLLHALQQQGHSVLVARDGDEALALAEKFRPDLIVLDLVMPKRSGLSVLEHLRHTRCASTPVIMITACSGRDQGKAMRLGVRDYLTKPFPPHRLVESVQRLLAA